MTVARRLGDIAALNRALSDRRHIGWPHDPPEERIRTGQELVEMAKSVDDVDMELQGHLWRMIGSLEFS